MLIVTKNQYQIENLFEVWILVFCDWLNMEVGKEGRMCSASEDCLGGILSLSFHLPWACMHIHTSAHTFEMEDWEGNKISSHGFHFVACKSFSNASSEIPLFFPGLSDDGFSANPWKLPYV